MADFNRETRIATLVFVLAAIASMSFTQLGFWSIGIIDGKPVYVLLILAPLTMGTLLFGPYMGAALGLFSGCVVYLHATYFPLDFYEVYFMTPLNSFVLLTFLGAAQGWLFHRVLQPGTQGAARIFRMVLVCAVISFAASGLTIVNSLIMYSGYANWAEILQDYLLISPLGSIAQLFVDLIAMALICIIADATIRSFNTRGNDRTLREVFRNWMLVVSAIVFMLTSGIIFCIATSHAQDNSKANMLGEIEYLQTQIENGAEPATLIEGYDLEDDGVVVFTDTDGVIVATDDDQRFPVGSSFVEQIGYGKGSEASKGFFRELIGSGGVSSVQSISDDGSQSLDLAHVATGRYDGGLIVVMLSSDMVYSIRSAVMVSLTLLALALIAAIAQLAVNLLNRVVVRRIDLTNDSLAKITDGNLNERVDVHATREFTSLSSGINTMVSALKGYIAEAEQRNAKDLATAKTIQESALPDDFPPFPEIDRFDIYANMKTAKEVGGDFYNFFLIDNDKLGFVMADVSGKGIPAALFMMTAKAQIQNYMEYGLPVDEAVNAANHQLCIGNDAGMFVTAWVGVLEYETGMLWYVNAGHNPPLLLHDGGWEWMREQSGMPLGVFDGIPYSSHHRQLEPEDMLFLYTDGVTEAMNVDKELFGDDRLETVLREFAAMNPRSVCIGIRRALAEFTQGAEQSDDITTLAVKYGVPPQKKALMVLPAEVSQLEHVRSFIHEELHRRRAPKSVWGPIDIAAEELFVNVCHYAYDVNSPEYPGEARISYEYAANPPSLTVEIADDGKPFNPLEKPDAETPDSIDDVAIGGLGIFMAKQSVDELAYRREGESNILTFRKGW